MFRLQSEDPISAVALPIVHMFITSLVAKHVNKSSVDKPTRKPDILTRQNDDGNERNVKESWASAWELSANGWP